MKSTCVGADAPSGALAQYIAYLHGVAPVNVSFGAFGTQHLDDLCAAFIAKQLALVFLMPGNVMRFHQREKVLRPVALEYRTHEMRIGADEVFRRGVEIGEIAAATTGDADFLANFLGVIDERDTSAALPRDAGAHHAGSTGTDCD